MPRMISIYSTVLIRLTWDQCFEWPTHLSSDIFDIIASQGIYVIASHKMISSIYKSCVLYSIGNLETDILEAIYIICIRAYTANTLLVGLDKFFLHTEEYQAERLWNPLWLKKKKTCNLIFYLCIALGGGRFLFLYIFVLWQTVSTVTLIWMIRYD